MTYTKTLPSFGVVFLSNQTMCKWQPLWDRKREKKWDSFEKQKRWDMRSRKGKTRGFWIICSTNTCSFSFFFYRCRRVNIKISVGAHSLDILFSSHMSMIYRLNILFHAYISLSFFSLKNFKLYLWAFLCQEDYLLLFMMLFL